MSHQRLQLNPAKTDWEDTLKRIANCSAVISVDTAVAHLLAAGSSKPTKLMLSDPPTGVGVLCLMIPTPPLVPISKCGPYAQLMKRCTSNAHHQWNLQSASMANSVFPEAVFTPAIAMISGNDCGGAPKVFQ